MILILYPPGWINLYPAHPLGIATLAAFLQAEGIECRQVDLEILAHEVNRTSPEGRIPLDEMLSVSRFSDLLKKNDDCSKLHEDYSSSVESLLSLIDTRGVKAVVFSVIGERQFISASILASFFHAQGIPVLAGGCYVNQNAVWISTLGIFDLLFTGFDTIAFAAACRNILRGKFESRAARESLICDSACSLDLLPKPQFSDSLAGFYRRAVKAIYKTGAEHLILQYLLDLGCTYRCNFCTRFHGKYETKAISKIVTEIKELAGEHHTSLFSLTTNGVNFEEGRALELYRQLSKSTNGLEWHAFAVPNLGNAELVASLARSGCKILRFGLESASDKMLRIFNKRFTPQQAVESFELAHRAGIWVQVNFILGSPQENEKDIEENCRLIERCHPFIDSIRINPFFLQHDSDISNRPEHYGIRLRSWSGSNKGFDEIGGLDWESKIKATIHGIHRMYSVMRKCGIGFYGISSHLLLCALHENGSKEEAKRWLDRVHPCTCENIPPELIQWKIYHAHELGKCPYGGDWESNLGLIYEKGLSSGVRRHDI